MPSPTHVHITYLLHTLIYTIRHSHQLSHRLSHGVSILDKRNNIYKHNLIPCARTFNPICRTQHPDLPQLKTKLETKFNIKISQKYFHGSVILLCLYNSENFYINFSIVLLIFICTNSTTKHRNRITNVITDYIIFPAQMLNQQHDVELKVI